MGILDVHNLIANVVGSLHQVHQRVAGIAFASLCVANLLDAQFLCNLFVVSLLGLEESELTLFRCLVAGIGVFDDAGQGGVGHDESAFAASLEVMGKQAEGIGVALEVC